MDVSDAPHYKASTSLSAYNHDRRLSKSSWSAVSRCAACLSHGISPFVSVRSFSYSRCDECGFVFANPRPTDEHLNAFYNSAFYDNYRTCERERIKATPYFSISTSSIPMIAEWIAQDRDAALLDFGCGPGSFLAYLRDRHGFTNLTGLELNRSSVEVARQSYGLNILSDPAALEGRRFDIVVLIEVIEHISDPDEVMQAVDHLLQPGGRLIVTTDAVDNPVAKRFPAWSPHFTGPSHISLFSTDALTRLLSRFGYDIERREVIHVQELLGNALAGPFYRLDFSSPASRDDVQDMLFVPTEFGRRLGLRPTRRLPRPLRALKRVDGMAARAIERFSGRKFPWHQFVVARKVG